MAAEPATEGLALEPAGAKREPVRPAAIDPVAGFAGITAIAGSVFVLLGVNLPYRYGQYILVGYRPGMSVYVAIVGICALVTGLLTLVPRTRARIGPALLLGVGLAATFGLLRFIGEVVTLSDGSGTELNVGFTFELVGHIALVVAGAGALAALRRNTAIGLGAGKPRGWEAWVAIVLGVVVAVGWIIQLAELTELDTSDGGRAAAYFVLGALLAVALPVAAVVLKPRPVACAVLATGTAGLSTVLAPTFAAVLEHSSLTYAGQAVAVAGLALLAIDTAVMAVRARNQPIGRHR